LVDAHRASFGLASPGVKWDAGLSHLLAPALYSYEHERLTGLTTGNALFSDSIKRAIPPGHTFKGFPQHFLALDPSEIMRAWLRSDVALDILQCRSYKASLAVRLRVFPMPDEVTSVWAMLAIHYRPDYSEHGV